jgi:hypothetical protein
MNREPDHSHIEATRGLLFGALGGLFIWSVALGYACHLIAEALSWL